MRRSGRASHGRYPGLAILAILCWLAASAAPAAAQDVQVTSADPPAAEQGTVNLDVVIGGKGFKNGAVARFLLSGTEDPGGITVNSTTFKNAGQLIANITVADNASVDKFDIEVTNTSGRRGKGIELFSVVEKSKGEPNQTCDDVSVTLVLRDDPTDSVRDDGMGPYPASLFCNNDANHLHSLLDGRPISFHLNNPVDPSNTFTLNTGLIPTNLGARIEDASGETLRGGFLEMNPGEFAYSEKVQFNFVVDNKRYFLSWGSDYPGASTATASHEDADNWAIETSPQPENIARLRECPVHGPCKSPVDRWYYAPFRIELSRVP